MTPTTGLAVFAVAATFAIGLGCSGGAPTPAGDDGGAADRDAAVVVVRDPNAPCGGCASGMTCCGIVCVDVANHEKHCGGCGQQCQDGELCGRSECRPFAMESLCAIPRATSIDDGRASDGDAATALSAALSACAPPVVVRTVSQAGAIESGLLDKLSLRPIVGRGELLAFAGGPFADTAVAYLESCSSPIVFQANEQTVGFAHRDGAAVLTIDRTKVTVHRDWFVAELVREPSSATVDLVVYGTMAQGTAAGAFWMRHAVLPALSTYGAQWYVMEWVDVNGDTLPDADDNFIFIAAG